MLSYEDCVAFSKLTPAGIDAIAEHEHILMAGPDGTRRLAQFVHDHPPAGNGKS